MRCTRSHPQIWDYRWKLAVDRSIRHDRPDQQFRVRELFEGDLRFGEIRFIQAGPIYFSVFQIGFAQDSAGEIGLREVAIRQVGVHQADLIQVGPEKAGAVQFALVDLCPREIRVIQGVPTHVDQVRRCTSKDQFNRIGVGIIDFLEAGLGKICADQLRSDEGGVDQVGIIEIRAAQVGFVENRVADGCAVKICHDHVGFGERRAQHLGADEDDPIHRGAHQGRPAQVGFLHRGAVQGGAPDLDDAHFGAVQRRAGKIGPGQVRHVDGGHCQVSISQIGARAEFIGFCVHGTPSVYNEICRIISTLEEPRKNHHEYSFSQI